MSTAATTSYAALAGSLHADVLVVGAGIVGLSTALRLCELGRSVVVLEARRVGQQVTGRSTAKITTQHGLIYARLRRTFGRAKAQSYADANSAGAAQIKAWVREHEIACDLERRDAYVFVREPEAVEDLVAEADAARDLGLVADLMKRAPLPFATAGALRFPDQAQFNPQAYLVGLAAAVTRAGGRIFEASPAVLVDAASRWRAVTSEGNVHADHIVIATNMTIKSPVGMSKRTQPRMHTAMAFRTGRGLVLEGMFIGAEEPTRSLRLGRDAEGQLLIALGPKFNTGQERDVAGRFRELDAWVRSHFDVGPAVWRWCNEDYDTADRVAVVGEPDPKQAPGFYIATGFNAWGISNGTAAGLLLADRIVGRPNPWSALYSPQRETLTEINAAAETQSLLDDPADIPAGGGGVISRGGEKLALWRDDSGKLHTLSASCTHKGCIVSWNNADRTWDCPCHGSMFEPNGKVLHGPARKPLASREQGDGKGR